jgi:hypothetical protein
LTRPLRKWRLVAVPEVEATDPHVQAVLFCNETVGTLVKNDLLDRELVYGWLWVSGSWERVGPPRVDRARRRGCLRRYVPGAAKRSPALPSEPSD